MAEQQPHAWEFVVAEPRSTPGVTSMVGYRALEVPDALHRGLPSSMLTFIVSLDDGVETADTLDGLAAARPKPLILAGLHVWASYVLQRRSQAGVQLAVHPLASRALFGVPSAELSVSDFDAALLGRRAVELCDRVAEARRWPDVFALVRRYLIESRQRREDADVRPEVAHAWHLLERSQGRIPTDALADRVGVSSRHLTTLFQREVGRSPKMVSKLMRFEHATVRISASVRRCGQANLAAVAADAGYYDQAHLSNEFVRFTGVPPRQWLREEFRNIQDGGHSFGSQWEDEHIEPDRLVDTSGP
jgi:AraC-like DNA-binding protein